MIFQKKVDYLSGADQTGLALGQTVKIPIDRTFPIESIFVIVNFTTSGVMATDNPDGLANIVNNLTLSVNDGIRQRNPVNVSGAGLLEFVAQKQINLDRQTLTALPADANASYQITYPIYCSDPQINDPVGSFFLLPVLKYPNDPVLEVRFSTQAQMDVHATPTFAVSALAFTVVVNRRIVNVTDFPYIDWDLTEMEQLFPASGTEQRIEIPAPGSYTGQLYRGYTSTSARGDISDATGAWRIESLGVVQRRFKFSHLQVENDQSRVVAAGSTVFNASYYNDFLTDKSGQTAGELGSVLDANIPQNSGARIYLIGGVTGGAGVKLKIVSHRIFGDLKKLKLVK